MGAFCSHCVLFAAQVVVRAFGGPRKWAEVVGVFPFVFNQLCTTAAPDFTFLAVLAIEAMAGREAEFGLAVQAVDFDRRHLAEVVASLAVLLSAPFCGTAVDGKSLAPSQFCPLGKSEVILCRGCHAPRCYAGDAAMHVLLQITHLKLIVIGSSDSGAVPGAVRSRLHPGFELYVRGVQSRLAAGAVNMVFVREGRFIPALHFGRVDNGSPSHVERRSDNLWKLCVLPLNTFALCNWAIHMLCACCCWFVWVVCAELLALKVVFELQCWYCAAGWHLLARSTSSL